MNHKHWSGFTAALLVTAISTASSTHAEPKPTVEQKVGETSHPSPNNFQPATNSAPVAAPEQFNSTTAQLSEVVKVGEYQSCRGTATSCVQQTDAQDAIAKIQPHELAGRTAATVYVRNIPVLTFLGSSTATSTNSVKVGEIDEKNQEAEQKQESNNFETNVDRKDPVWRATALAAQLNRLHRENVDATKIVASWESNQEHYIIKADGKELAVMDDRTQLPDTTSNPAEDVLQATNRLRRQFGNAPPLKDIEGRPLPEVVVPAIERPIGAILRFTGFASWYGPGFHGNQSASGEIFNQNALTAAHRNLPFGTLVRVTNLDNGLSVVVRINDRGPFVGDRIIDLSAGAARVLGLLNSGVAPVRLDVLGTQNAAADGY